MQDCLSNLEAVVLSNKLWQTAQASVQQAATLLEREGIEQIAVAAGCWCKTVCKRAMHVC